MSAFVPSPSQTDLFNFVEHERGSAIVVSVAGSGKSTSIAHALLRLRPRTSARVLMFNAPVARDFEKKLAELERDAGRKLLQTWNAAERRFEGDVAVGTFHALGWSAVLKFFRDRKIAVFEGGPDGKKLSKIVREKFSPEVVAAYGSFAMKLVSYAKGEGVGPLVPDTEDAWWRIVSHHDLSLDSEVTIEGVDDPEAEAIRVARQLLHLSNEAAKAGHVDFDDQIYLPVLWRLRLWQHDVVFIDEAQDTNPIRRALAKMVLRPGGRLFAVGDPRQGIYGFTGASTDAMDLIKREFNAVEKRLTVSYRCSRAIAAHAREIVPYFEALPGAPEGAIRSLSTADAIKVLRPTDAVLCRNTKPLIDLAYDLIGRGVGCKVLGREIGEALTALVRKMRAKGIENLLERLNDFRAREVAKHMAKGEEGKAEAVSDKVACIVTIVERMTEGRDRTIPKLIERIEAMFSDETGGVLTLSTAHKSKGREWDRVAILKPELMPSKWARQTWQQEQEQNLIYVARTRARTELIYLITDEPKKPAPMLTEEATP